MSTQRGFEEFVAACSATRAEMLARVGSPNGGFTLTRYNFDGLWALWLTERYSSFTEAIAHCDEWFAEWGTRKAACEAHTDEGE
jgi:hypothetical protein